MAKELTRAAISCGLYEMKKELDAVAELSRRSSPIKGIVERPSKISPKSPGPDGDTTEEENGKITRKSNGSVSRVVWDNAHKNSDGGSSNNNSNSNNSGVVDENDCGDERSSNRSSNGTLNEGRGSRSVRLRASMVKV